MKDKGLRYFIIGTFITLYAIVSIISTIHVIEFFRLSNPEWLAISLAIAFEIGAAASLASLIALKKMNRTLVWSLFIVLTAMQMMGNTYYAFTNLENYKDWVDLFGLTEEEPIFQKRILSIISGAVLPLVALGFIKSLVDYIKPSEEERQPKQIVNKDEALHVANYVITYNNEETLPNEINNEEENAETVYSEDDKKAIIEAIQVVNENSELTKEDIEVYKNKSRTPPRGSEKIKNITNNPHVVPGVRT
jgi:hypothetical protein